MARAVAVLERLGSGPQSLAGLAAALSAPKSSLLRVLRALEDGGLVRRDGASGRYALGLRFLALSAGVLEGLDVRAAARPHLERLAREHGESVHLGVYDAAAREVVCVDKVDSPQPVHFRSWVGKRNVAHATALGKALLAALGPAELDAYLEHVELRPLTPRTLAGRAELLADLERTRARGYSLNDEENTAGVRSAGAAVRALEGTLAGLSVAGPASRLPRARLHAIGADVAAAARTISRELGGLAPTGEPEGARA